MPVTFALADEAATLQLAEVMAAYHQPLHDAAVLVGALFARNDKDGEPSIQVKGVARSATIRVVSLKDRVLKRVDAELVIAKEVWDELARHERRALLDHELCHVQLKKFSYTTLLGPDGRPRRGPDGLETGEKQIEFDLDDLGRPQLKIVPGDLDAGDAFEQVIRRHGSAATEYRVLARAGHWAERAYNGFLGLDRSEGSEEEFQAPTSDFRGATVTFTTETGEVIERPLADIPAISQLGMGDAA